MSRRPPGSFAFRVWHLAVGGGCPCLLCSGVRSNRQAVKCAANPTFPGAMSSFNVSAGIS